MAQNRRHHPLGHARPAAPLLRGQLRRAASAAVLLLLAGVASLPAQRAHNSSLLDSATARLARLDGSVTVPGLDSTVEVRRDRWGVPHIYARTQHDLFLAQGYVAAQDRLWQLEMWRRQGEGRLAEVLGASAVERDRFARLLRYRGDMDAEWAAYGPDTREIVHAFVKGINAYIAQVRDNPPIEFTLAGLQPEPWTEDVVIQRMAALAVSGNALSEVRRARLVAQLGAQTVEALFPIDPPRRLDPPPSLQMVGISARSLGAAAEAFGAPAFSRVEGSNNWVVSGARSATGKPLLANDPHRAIGVPSLRYIAHLVGPGWNVIGSGEPALPGIGAGHNERVGFGFTVVGMDQQDVYVETLRPCDQAVRRRYALPPDARCYNDGDRGWQPIRVITERISIRGADEPRSVNLEFTSRGPIVGEDEARGRAFVLRWVGFEPGTAGYLAQLGVNRATDWNSFVEAAARWRMPGENLIYADVDGNIGWVAAGLMPRRSWSGLLPVPGGERYNWSGYLPASELPRSYNPESGMIVTANNNIIPRGYSHQLSHEWAPPYRARRITQLLEAQPQHSVSDFQRIQLDEYSEPASRMVPIIVAAAEARGHSSSPEVQALARWNHVMHRDSLAPLVYAVWLTTVARRVYEPRISVYGASFTETGWDLETLQRLLERPDNVFGNRNPEAGRDQAVMLALDDALQIIQQRLGPKRDRWTWGSLHKAIFRHPLSELLDLPEVPRGGDAHTVNATGGANFLQRSGATYRQVLDVADWDNSMVTSAPGQSGQPGSPFFDNLLKMWSNGEYFPLVYSRERVEKETAHILMLEPR